MPSIFNNHLDSRIYNAIKGHTAAKPQNLAGIIAYVDSQEKLVITREELSTGITRLIEDGLVAESEKHLFVETVKKGAAGSFSGISADEYETAFREYLKSFDERVQQDDPGVDFTCQKLIIRWKLDGDAYGTDEDEDAAEAFADAVEPAIAKSGLGEISGFEYGPGIIDILIFGKETEDDIEEIYSLVVDTFKSYGCPSGSCIIKCYDNPRRDVACDRIA
jgi:hypothetical protein